MLLPVGLGAAFLYRGWLVYPYITLHPEQVRSTSHEKSRPVTDPDMVRLLNANAYQENTRTSDVLKLIAKRQPDVVLLLETNEVWKRPMQPIEAEYPHRIVCLLENIYGPWFTL